MINVFPSLTSSGVLHDKANFLVEIMLLNSNILAPEFPWKNNPKGWGQKVACIKKLVRDFNISYEQLGCYIYRCSVTKLDSKNFAKMAFMAKKLIPSIELDQIYKIYSDKKVLLKDSNLKNISYKQNKIKTLQEFLKELENE